MMSEGVWGDVCRNPDVLREYSRVALGAVPDGPYSWAAGMLLEHINRGGESAHALADGMLGRGENTWEVDGERIPGTVHQTFRELLNPSPNKYEPRSPMEAVMGAVRNGYYGRWVGSGAQGAIWEDPNWLGSHLLGAKQSAVTRALKSSKVRVLQENGNHVYLTGLGARLIVHPDFRVTTDSPVENNILWGVLEAHIRAEWSEDLDLILGGRRLAMPNIRTRSGVKSFLRAGGFERFSKEELKRTPQWSYKDGERVQEQGMFRLGGAMVEVESTGQTVTFEPRMGTPYGMAKNMSKSLVLVKVFGNQLSAYRPYKSC